MTIAYAYKWTHLPTMKYYIGSKTSKGCHPNDGYLCSSKTVKPMIDKNPQDWERTIIAIGTPDDMWNLETEILQTFDCANDPRSFNKHNNNFKFRYDKTGIKESATAIKNKADGHRGKKRPRQAELMRGKKRPEFAEKMKGKLVGEKNPSSKSYIITDPHGNQFEITSLKAFAEYIDKPLVTAREIASKYTDNTAKSGAWMGWSIRFK
jgi:hypothetical protein